MGVEHYVATLKLTPVTDGNRSFAEWSAEFDCDEGRERELTDTIGNGVFQGGFDALKRHFADASADAAKGRPLHRHRRADRARVGGAARLQQPRPVARRGGRRAASRATSAATRSAACAASRWSDGNRIREQLLTLDDRELQEHLLHRRSHGAAAALRGHGDAEAGDRRQPHLLALGVDLRHAAGHGSRTARDGGQRRLRSRLRMPAPPPARRRRPAHAAAARRCPPALPRAGAPRGAAPLRRAGSAAGRERRMRRRPATARCASASAPSASTSSTSTCAAAGSRRCCRCRTTRPACPAWRPPARARRRPGRQPRDARRPRGLPRPGARRLLQRAQRAGRAGCCACPPRWKTTSPPHCC